MNIPETAVRNTFKKFSYSNKQIEEMIKPSFLSSKKKEIYLQIWNKKQGLFY
jgi:serine/threonine-protein kinase HipA